jgi:hypothetical protein
MGRQLDLEDLMGVPASVASITTPSLAEDLAANAVRDDDTNDEPPPRQPDPPKPAPRRSFADLGRRNRR